MHYVFKQLTDLHNMMDVICRSCHGNVQFVKLYPGGRRHCLIRPIAQLLTPKRINVFSPKYHMKLLQFQPSSTIFDIVIFVRTAIHIGLACALSNGGQLKFKPYA